MLTTTLELVPAAEPRHHVAQVTEASIDGWRAFCERFSVDRNALGEVLGLRLGELGDRLPPFLERCVRDAQTLAAERRRRL